MGIPLYLPPEKPVCNPEEKVRTDMEQQTGYKLGKVYNKDVYFYPVYINSMQCTS